MISDTVVETGIILAVPDWTQLGFAPLSIPTSSPIVDCEPALDDGVWARKSSSKDTQAIEFLRGLCMIREASLEPDLDQYCPQEGSLMRQLADSIKHKPTSRERDYFNDACLFGYLGRKAAAVIDKAVFELKDPASKHYTLDIARRSRLIRCL